MDVAPQRRGTRCQMTRITSRFVLLIATAAVAPLVLYGLISVTHLRSGTQDSVTNGNLQVAGQVSERIRELCAIVAITEDTHVRGLALAERYQLNVYDGMIVAAAQLAGCTVLYSEDMHDGLVIDRLTIRNPYREGT